MIKSISKIKATWLLTVLLTLWVSVFMNAQSVDAGIQSDANAHFEKGNYRTALRLYRQAGSDHSTNKKIRLRIGICLFEINDVDSAIRKFQSLIDQGKTHADVFLYMGKSYQSKTFFPEAITYYKKFIDKTKRDNPLIEWAKDELTRCANGARLKFGDEETYVENAGTSINTQYTEFGVKNSPTTLYKIYFNSNRTEEATAEESNTNVDIYSTELENGRWSTPAPLPSSINSHAYNEVYGFSLDGQIIYYLTPIGDEYKIKTDTFTDHEGSVYQGLFTGPFQPSEGGTDLAFFNDSICLFSSNAPGGYGGFDLYISIAHDGVWSQAANLGPTINSFYNERFPFLTKNGQTLFFSSDNLESVGGLDIFRTVFDPEKLTWSLPDNLGFPVNSSLDDTHMVLAPDGITGYISSNRKTGYGDFDIYRVFFKQAVLAHLQVSLAPTFYQLQLLHGKDQITTDAPERPVEVKEYFLSHLFIEESGDVLSPQNIKKLDLLANLLLIYPKIHAELSGFEVPTGQQAFNLYFSIKKVEKAAEYLERKGIQRNRLILKGYGSSFPLVLDQLGTQPSAVYLKLNHRMEIGLHHFENEPVETHIEYIPVPDNLRDPHGEKFSSLRHGLYYSVQLVSISQILQNASLESLDEMFIEVDNTQGNYKYMSGMIPLYDEAEKRLKEMIELGFTDAFIVPYVDGLRISHDTIIGLTELYPDLLVYLEKTKK